MIRPGVRVGVGTRFSYDGEAVEVVEMHSVRGMPQVVTRDVRTETVRRFALDELMFSERARLLGEDLVVQDVDKWGFHRLGDVVCCAGVHGGCGSRARWARA